MSKKSLSFLTSKHLLYNFLNFFAEQAAIFERQISKEIACQILFLQLLRMGQGNGCRTQCMPNLLPGFMGFYIAGYLVLLICIPLGIPKQRELAGEIAYRFEIGTRKAKNIICFHKGH